MQKSSIFIAGVDEDTKAHILERTGFSLGEFPIRYLGLPLSPKKWKKIDCCSLITKITQRIKVTYTKTLSADYNVYPSPKHTEGNRYVMQGLLLGRSDEKRKIALVSWENVCYQKIQSGLNIKGSRTWNITSVGQLI
ncbi:hypothetical protein H5410_006998 [Solanum commersonii]|uniref:Uncharacterized protein n=1 Tax=Solanum commersonii TaxID=4109 RepID=A0A9J6ABT8_SOLCO|nr:hypothetical protein H5410_006998 [Solanum commersonii]